jgi:putative mycofactocin binding protein MftB
MAALSMEARYKLAPGIQVREEDFGLLFYTQEGPGLYYVSSGDLLGEDFFSGCRSLRELPAAGPRDEARLSELKKALDVLKGKGVILEC